MSIYRFNDKGRAAYKAIYDAVSQMRTQAVIPDMAPKTALTVYNKVLSENRNGIYYRPSKVQLNTAGITHTLTFEMIPIRRGKHDITMQATAEIDSLIRAAKRKGTPYEQIRYVYEYFVSNYEYAHEDTTDRWYHCSVGPFLYGRSVCEGFALAMATVLNEMKIPCGIVYGRSRLNSGSAEEHSWNIVGLGRESYHMDVTWDICTKHKSKDLYDYLLLDDALMKRDHSWSDHTLPPCTDGQREMYTSRQLCCGSREDAVLILRRQLLLKPREAAVRFVGFDASPIMDQDCLSAMIAEAARKEQVRYSRTQYTFNKASQTVVYHITY